MTNRRLVLASISAALLLAGWVGWRWATTPVPPELTLDRTDAAVVEAVGAARDAVLRAPRSGTAWGKLAMVLAANGYADEAGTCFAQAERFDPADPRWPYLRGHGLMSHDPPAAVLALERALAHAELPQQRAVIHFRLALALLEAGALDGADDQLRALRSIEPAGPRLHFGLGLLAIARDDRATATAELSPLIGNPFTRRRAQTQLAALALADGDAELARLYQNRAALLPPDPPWPDPFLDAVAQYGVSRLVRLRHAEGLFAQGKLPEALPLLRQLAAEAPDARTCQALGLTLAKLNALEEAESVLRTALRLEPGHMQAHHTLASVLLRRGEVQLQTPGGTERAQELFRRAVAEADQALAAKGDDATAHLTRGRALQHLGQTDAALAALREAVVCRPEFAETHLQLGEALAEAGQLPAALSHLEDAVRLALPGDAAPRAALEKWRAAAKSGP
jgi:tetratricopeptide (TPR) repeat protein